MGRYLQSCKGQGGRSDGIKVERIMCKLHDNRKYHFYVLLRQFMRSQAKDNFF